MPSKIDYSSEKFNKLMTQFQDLEDSGALAASPKEKSTIEKFMESNENKQFLSKPIQEKVEEKKAKEKRSKEKLATTHKEPDVKSILTEGISKDSFDWDSIEMLYMLGKKKGFIK